MREKWCVVVLPVLFLRINFLLIFAGLNILLPTQRTRSVWLLVLPIFFGSSTFYQLNLPVARLSPAGRSFLVVLLLRFQCSCCEGTDLRRSGDGGRSAVCAQEAYILYRPGPISCSVQHLSTHSMCELLPEENRYRKGNFFAIWLITAIAFRWLWNDV